jgi:CRP-like cAMP-binding protein
MGCGSSSGSQAKVQPEDSKSNGETAAAPEKEKSKSPSNDADKKQAKEQAKEENKDFAKTMQFLAKVPLFQRLPKDQHPLLAAACAAVDFKAGEKIIKQGDVGHEFFVIKSGCASVDVGGTKVAGLKPGDYFGENALLRDEPRTATIVADDEISTFRITREKFQELGLNENLHFANRNAVGGGGGVRKELVTKPPSEKNEQEKQLITDALKNNDNLQTMVVLSDERINQMIDVAWKEEVKENADIIKEGDLSADYFYVVQEGTFEISVNTEGPQPQSAERVIKRGESKIVTTVTQGGSFGELALLYLVPRAATVKAKTAGVVWVIDRFNFKTY